MNQTHFQIVGSEFDRIYLINIHNQLLLWGKKCSIFFNGKAIPLTWWREPASYRPSIHFLNHLVQGCRRLEPHLPQDERRGTDRTACQFITEIQRTIHSHIHTSTLLTEFALHVKISLLIMRIIIQACGGKHISYSCGGAFKHLRQSLCDKPSLESLED